MRFLLLFTILYLSPLKAVTLEHLSLLDGISPQLSCQDAGALDPATYWTRACEDRERKISLANFPPEILNTTVELPTRRHGIICKYCRPQAGADRDSYGYYQLNDSEVISACNHLLVKGAAVGSYKAIKAIPAALSSLGEVVIRGGKYLYDGFKLQGMNLELVASALKEKSNLELAKFLIKDCPQLEIDLKVKCEKYAFMYHKPLQALREKVAGFPVSKDSPQLNPVLEQDRKSVV